MPLCTFGHSLSRPFERPAAVCEAGSICERVRVYVDVRGWVAGSVYEAGRQALFGGDSETWEAEQIGCFMLSCASGLKAKEHMDEC